MTTPDTDENRARYHMDRAKAIWAAVPEQQPQTQAQVYHVTYQIQCVDWHLKFADLHARLASLPIKLQGQPTMNPDPSIVTEIARPW